MVHPEKRARVVAFLVACISIASTDSHAQTVQKCLDAQGGVRYQSLPCGRGDRTLASWDAVPDETVPARRDVGRASGRSGGEGSKRATRSRRPASSAASLHAPRVHTCDQAKAYRDAVERQVGLARTYELLTALSRHVYDACR